MTLPAWATTTVHSTWGSPSAEWLTLRGHASSRCSFPAPGSGGGGWGANDRPGTATVLVVEAFVYGLALHELVGACQSEAMSPSEVERFLSGVGRRVGAEMTKPGRPDDSVCDRAF